MKNYVTVAPDNFLFRFLFLFYNYFMYVDGNDRYFADVLFYNHRVRVHFMQDYVSPNGRYMACLCRVRKKDTPCFLDALAELPTKMYLCGYSDYDKECARLFNGKENLQ